MVHICSLVATGSVIFAVVVVVADRDVRRGDHRDSSRVEHVAAFRHAPLDLDAIALCWRASAAVTASVSTAFTTAATAATASTAAAAVTASAPVSIATTGSVHKQLERVHPDVLKPRVLHVAESSDTLFVVPGRNTSAFARLLLFLFLLLLLPLLYKLAAFVSSPFTSSSSSATVFFSAAVARIHGFHVVAPSRKGEEKVDTPLRARSSHGDEGLVEETAVVVPQIDRDLVREELSQHREPQQLRVDEGAHARPVPLLLVVLPPRLWRGGRRGR